MLGHDSATFTIGDYGHVGPGDLVDLDTLRSTR
jgi:hypothetical protein